MTEQQQPVWMKYYPEHLKNGVDTSAYANVIDLLDEVFEKNHNQDAFKMMGDCISFNNVNRHCKQLATYFKDIGLVKGDSVAIMMPNIFQFPISLFAIWRAGLIGVNVNPLYTAGELAKQLNNANCKAIVILDVFAQTLEQALPEIPSLKHIIVTKIGDHMGLLKGSLVNYVAKNIKKAIPKYNLPAEQTVSYSDALFLGSQHEYEAIEISPDDIALLQFTGGTTGVSKGAVLLHRNIVTSILYNDAWFYPALKPVLDDKETQLEVVTVLPLYHIFSLIVTLLAFRLGGKCLLIANPRDFVNMMKTISKNKIHVFPSVNTLYNAFLNHKYFHKMKLDHLVLSVGGGAPIQTNVSKNWYAKTGTYICEGYGLSECSPVVCCNTVHIPPKIGSIGFPHPNTDVKLIDEDGNEIRSSGIAGELIVKGPQVMREYWNNSLETEQSFTADGYFKTGDIAQFDDDGYFFIVDRKKDMILVSGFNVYPNEIEDVVMQLEGIKECAVIGVKNEKSGERVKLYVVADPHITDEIIRNHCKKMLTGYKRPYYIEFKDTLPKTNVGKILRKQLKDELTQTS